MVCALVVGIVIAVVVILYRPSSVPIRRLVRWSSPKNGDIKNGFCSNGKDRDSVLSVLHGVERHRVGSRRRKCVEGASVVIICRCSVKPILGTVVELCP